jgi:hypothetical protein
LDVVAAGDQDVFHYISAHYNGNSEAPDENITTVELHLSGLIGTVSHPDMQKIRMIGLFFENRLHWLFEMEKKN